MGPMPVLLPQPRRMRVFAGRLVLTRAQARAVERLKPRSAAVAVRLAPDLLPRPQQHRLDLGRRGIAITAHDEAGVFHAAVTLRQLLRQSAARALPCLRLDDWPDFPVRGYMLDISRDRVPTMATLRQLVDDLAELKINQLQLYTEHTFAYRRHRAVWRAASPMTAAQVRTLDRWCRARRIELVPNQNCFGHWERWLRHPRYRPLAETPDGFVDPWGNRRGPTTLCPTDPRAVRLVAELLAELLPNFTSSQVNVGCDETWDLGQGRSAGWCRRRGKTRVYLDFVRRIHRIVARHGRTMQFWGDIILHEPGLLGRLPGGVIALEWGYEADHPFARHCRRFAASGVPFYVCPGTSTWNSIAGRTRNALANLRRAAAHGRRHGAAGYLVTDWGDNGHMQPYAVSLLPLAHGAAAAWCARANAEATVSRGTDRHLFQDAAGVLGAIAAGLGNVWERTGCPLRNQTVLGALLYSDPAGTPRWLERLAPQRLDTTAGLVRRVLAPLARSRSVRPDAALLRQEFDLAGRMLQFACAYGAARCRAPGRRVDAIPIAARRRLAGRLESLIAEYGAIWRRRSRPGGLTDSAGRLWRLVHALRVSHLSGRPRSPYS